MFTTNFRLNAEFSASPDCSGPCFPLNRAEIYKGSRDSNRGISGTEQDQKTRQSRDTDQGKTHQGHTQDPRTHTNRTRPSGLPRRAQANRPISPVRKAKNNIQSRERGACATRPARLTLLGSRGGHRETAPTEPHPGIPRNRKQERADNQYSR